MSDTLVAILMVTTTAIGWPIMYLLGVLIERERHIDNDKRRN